MTMVFLFWNYLPHRSTKYMLW